MGTTSIKPTTIPAAIRTCLPADKPIFASPLLLPAAASNGDFGCEGAHAMRFQYDGLARISFALQVGCGRCTSGSQEGSGVLGSPRPARERKSRDLSSRRQETMTSRWTSESDLV